MIDWNTFGWGVVSGWLLHNIFRDLHGIAKELRRLKGRKDAAPQEVSDE